MNKKIILSSVFYLVFTIKMTAQLKMDTTLLEWNTNKLLTWNNFEGANKKISVFKAESVTFFKTYFYLKKDSVFFSIKTYFDKKKSWRNSSCLFEDYYGLNHEQQHFNITELFARKIRAIIFAKNLNEKEIESIFNENIKACNDFQDLYDKETNHSLNKTNQVIWDKKVKNLLLSLDKYEEQPIHIKTPFCKVCWAE